MLILYPAALLNSFFTSNLCVYIPWDFLRTRACHLQIEIALHLPSNLGTFKKSYLIALPRTSSTILRRSGKNRHPCLVPSLKGKAFSLSSLSVTRAIGFLRYSELCWESSLQSLACRVLSYHERVLEFAKCPLPTSMWVLPFILLHCYSIDWVLYVELILGS